MIAFFKDDEKWKILFLCLSAVSLAVSFFNIGMLPIDAAWLAILLCGIPIIKGAMVGLVTEFDIKADVLVSIALIAAVLIGEIFAAGEVAFIMTIGAFLEERTVAKARAGIEKLVHLSPATAKVVRDGEEYVVPAEQVKVGDTLRVLAGETIAVDGVITKGQTSVDQSVMTGESLPVDKNEGDEVQSGTVNQFGTFEMVAQKVGEDSSLQRMIHLVESADAGKAKIVGIADRWATWIVVIALFCAVITWFVTGEIIRSVTILVVFCPCALVLATPTAIMAGIGNATKYGILVSQGDALERLAKVRRIAFDKTGTLTKGKPSVMRVESCATDMDSNKLLEITATAELHSEHPLGKAIVAHYRQGRGKSPAEPEAFQLLPGRGVMATVQGYEIFAGNEALVIDHHLEIPEQLVQSVDNAKADGSTVIYVLDKKHVIGLIALSDTLRPDATQTVKEINETGTKTVLLTGDAPQAANHIAKIAGITDVRANCLPEDKLIAIKQYQNSGEPVCMVGDGINDAPALKAAQVGIAMGGIGSDITIEAADIVLVGDDIKEIPHLLLLSRKVMHTININLVASMLLNFAAIALAITGILNPVVGALVHNVGSVAVIINSSLLLKWRKKP
ncbi:heavy metal translocating P-type ATPase [Desulforamulus aeronauticus]|uniref:Cd(2+)-exporting ATPase n=1 Tax=Desulforamulus aeronauticus DSM 10349 TaxID=1121421 RepID=A0A1M6W760_9FIRM|nr:cation-translocating P-type ATPase [Desulforamulus aeronauticus]SHK89541.1 copper-(or silver)-translocating P-type ATPase [Desulforamulus aeronauticus DSM 10349]